MPGKGGGAQKQGEGSQPAVTKTLKEIEMSVTVDKQLCVGCGQCEPICPEKAIHVWGTAQVKEERCTDCLICLGFCPIKGALEVKNA